MFASTVKPTMEPPRILVVEDEGIVALDIRLTLESLGYKVTGGATSAEQAFQLIKKEIPDLVLMDIRIQGDSNGIQLAHELKARYRLPIVYLTAHADDATLKEAKLSNPLGYINKPFTAEDLKVAVEIALETHRIQTELGKSNQSLTALAHSIAHDLREPLRAVHCYSSLLAEAAESLSVHEREFLEYITSGCSRMQQMLSALLDYYRTGDAHAPGVAVDSSLAVKDALANLSFKVETSRAKIRVSELPIVRINKIALVQIFQNLLSNSIRYACSTRNPEISIDAEMDGPFCKFTVSDNGDGFDPSQTEEIFRLFSQAHVHQRSGTGIGLATCRRLVEQYGGSIWAESMPGQGARFNVFTPPSRERQLGSRMFRPTAASCSSISICATSLGIPKKNSCGSNFPILLIPMTLRKTGRLQMSS